MSCPTCEHTMHGLGDRWFWCPRCGTTLNEHDRHRTISIPGAIVQARNLVLQPSVTSSHARATLRWMVLTAEERASLEAET